MYREFPVFTLWVSELSTKSRTTEESGLIYYKEIDMTFRTFWRTSTLDQHMIWETTKRNFTY